MNYKKKYKEALERAKRWADGTLQPESTTPQGVCEAIFPELTESEDERIIKTIHEYIKNRNWMLNGPTKEEVLAWLERQKEEEGYEIIPVESTLEYKLGFNAGKESVKQKEQKPAEWSEEDEKMIERLITRLNWITYNTRTDGTSPNITFFEEIDWLKSLRPSLSDEEIKKIRSEEYTKGFNDCLLGKQKGWSEEDEKMRWNLISAFTDKNNSKVDEFMGLRASKAEILDFLKSLRPSWKPSEEQMEALNAIVALGQLSYVSQGQHLIDLYNDLQTKL